MAKRAVTIAETVLETPESTVLDLIDELLNKGVMATGDVTLGVAGIDLIYLRLSTLLCAADRVLPRDPTRAEAQAQASPARRPEIARRPQASREDRPSSRAVWREAIQTCRRGAGHGGGTARAARRDRAAHAADARLKPRAPTSRAPLRWNPQPEDVQRSVAQLVLTIVEFLRRLMERQAIRRMEQKTLTRKEVDDVGRALMQLEETVRDIGARFGLTPRTSTSIWGRSAS